MIRKFEIIAVIFTVWLGFISAKLFPIEIKYPLLVKKNNSLYGSKSLEIYLLLFLEPNHGYTQSAIMADGNVG